MDLSRKAEFSSSGHMTPIVSETHGVGGGDQVVWTTEDEYKIWNSSDTHVISSYEVRPPPMGSEPPMKKARTLQSGESLVSASNRSKAIGKMFFKTKLCCNFRAGVCPYITNCNFAHGVEELRKPPPNWQEILAAHEEERNGILAEPPREEHQIPTFSSSDLRMESQRSYKGRLCKKFYTDEGCPYGENCTFLHDEQPRARESFAISLSPSVITAHANGIQKPSNWKTRICNKWETTGTCPFGNKCHFAHGYQELNKYGGGYVDGEMRESSVTPDTKQSTGMVRMADHALASSSVPLGLGLPPQRPSSFPSQSFGQRSNGKWKGPDKISKIYGDWIDDIE